MTGFIDQDITKVKSGLIGQQVNMRGVMGAGLAKQIAKKWPKVKEEYKKNLSLGYQLGWVGYTQVSKSLIVACLYSQEGYGRSSKHTDYAYLGKALHSLYHTSVAESLPVYLPYKLGCGLGGGNWDEVQEIINCNCPNAVICLRPVDLSN